MPVPANVVRANIRATVGTNEELVHTLHFRRVNTTNNTQKTVQEIADLIVEKWTDFIVGVNNSVAAPASFMRSDLVYRTVDTYDLDADGHATTQGQALFGATAKGTSASTPMPPECAVVATLRTGLPGRSKRGRLYLGGFVSSTVGLGGTVGTNAQGSLSEGLADFGHGMKDPSVDTLDRLNWSVLSRTLTQTNRITLVSVGSLFDVQRRRQNGIPETFTSHGISY